MFWLNLCFPSFLSWGFLGTFQFKGPQFISKTLRVGVGRSPVYILKGVNFGGKDPNFSDSLILSWFKIIIRHTINKINITTSLNPGDLWYIKPYKGGDLPPSKVPRKTGQKVEVGNFDL
ncbi:MAG TPA: hypothetical protein PKK85_06805 [Methanobacteriaceae archaeon]|nr:hypothetical protein [Methanobacteriaceae archaeon]